MQALGTLNESELTLRIQALPQSQDIPYWLSSRQSLTGNDRFAIHVKSGRPLFLYVFNVPQVGTSSALYMPAENSAPQRELRLPLESGYFTLGQQAGRERIRLIGSTDRLSAEQLERHSRPPRGEGERDPERGKEEPEKEAPPPPVIPEGERDPRIVRVLLDASGIGVAQFDFGHR
ncbi:MAG TPA: DUF4384 domain-containing protein [Pseudomonadota bacterium]|nr:DUF4384 domain-containing protein [Pseudomonadota bacterium]